MVKKSEVQKLNAATDMAKNLGFTPETLINDSDLCVPSPVVSKKPSNNKRMCVRRSGRLQSAFRSAQNQEVVEIDLVESEREEDVLHVKDLVKQPFLESEPCNDDLHNEPTPNQKTLDEKVALIRAAEALKSPNQKTLDEKVDLIKAAEALKSPNQKTLDEKVDLMKAAEALKSPNQKTLDEKVDLMKAAEALKSKGAKGHDSCESTLVNFIYKSLYFDSKKKIEALTSENHELASKLEIALGKLEVYENTDKSTGTVMQAVVGLVSQVIGQSSSLGGAAELGGGAMPKKSSVKKQKT